MNRAEQAAKLAEMGFYVFPLRAKGKTPRHQGWQEKATRDVATIETWWQNHPADNIGIFTGKYGDDGQALLVIDVDNKNGKKGDAEIKKLADQGISIPVTLEQTTPTGGRHLIYTVDTPVRSGTNVLGDGLDIRSAGGYIVAPGSATEVGKYSWVGDGRLVAQADGSIVAMCGRARSRNPKASVPLVEEDQDANVARAGDYLKTTEPAVEGNAGDFRTYQVACQVRDLSISESLCLELMLEHYNERCQPQWDPEALADKVKNAYRYANQPPGNATVEADFGIPIKTDVVADAPRLKELSPFPTGAPNLDRSYLVKDWLRPGQMSLLVGQSNVGKTFVALDLLLAIARGNPWFGKRTEKRAVAYIAAEGIAGIELRLHAYKRHHGLSDQEVLQLPFGYLAAGINLRDSEREKKQLIEILKTFEARCGVKLGLVVIDTLARAMAGGNENAAEDVGAYIRTSDEIREATGAHIMHIHHLGKDASKGARGSSALRAAVDSELVIAPGKEGGSTISATKQRDLIGGTTGTFRLVNVEIGTDQDGDQVFSCAVHQCSETEVDMRKQTLEPKEQQALDLLRDKITREGVEVLPGTGLPPGIRAFPKEAWREVCEATLSGGEKATRQRVARKVHSALIAKQHISEGEGFVWISP